MIEVGNHRFLETQVAYPYFRPPGIEAPFAVAHPTMAEQQLVAFPAEQAVFETPAPQVSEGQLPEAVKFNFCGTKGLFEILGNSRLGRFLTVGSTAVANALLMTPAIAVAKTGTTFNTNSAARIELVTVKDTGRTGASPQSPESPAFVAASATNPGIEVGVVDNNILLPGTEEGQARANAITNDMAKMGLDRVTIMQPVSFMENSLGNNLRVGSGTDLDRFCTAAKAASKAHLRFKVIMLGFKDGKIGYGPLSSQENTNWVNMMRSMINALAGPIKPSPKEADPNTVRSLSDSDVTAYRCSADLHFDELEFAPYNEPNLAKVFWKKARSAPKAAARTLLNVYKAKLPLEEELGIPIYIDAPETTSGHTAPAFFYRFGLWLKKYGTQMRLKSPWKNVNIAHNAYGQNPIENPLQEHPQRNIVGLGDLPTLRQIGSQAFGEKLPITIGEYGQESEPELKNFRRFYPTGEFPFKGMSESLQAHRYAVAVIRAFCMGVKQINIFHFRDDPDAAQPWASAGVEHYDGSRKKAYYALKRWIKKIKHGDKIPCPVTIPESSP